MTILIGTYSLYLAIPVVALTLLVSLAAVRFGSQRLDRAARGGIIALAVLLSISAAALLVGLLQSDFRLWYVIRYTELKLPAGYKAAAFWAGQEGSLLLWGWLLAAMGVVFILPLRRERGPEHTAAVGTLAAVIGFFIILMLYADCNPFQTVQAAPQDGRGLNPMLQDPGMIAHPPILFVGYAGFTIPFALLIGALITGRLDNTWVLRARPWALVSWMFLGAGIILGAEWAYTELGWGGYWAWDPVENASLLPWLTGTALLHSILAHRQRGVFKRWSALLAAATFLLCIFGTYITRSGVVDSVHTFGKSLVGTFFGLFLILAVLLTVALVAWRWSLLRSERAIEGVLTREGGILSANILLVAMTVATLFGTMLPAITKAMAGEAKSANQNFYTYSVLPLAVLLMGVMGLAPVLGYGRAASRRLMRGTWLLPVAAATVSGVVFAAGVRNAWVLACAAVAVVVTGAILLDLCRSAWTSRREKPGNLLLAVLRLVDENHRRYGAQVAHLGMVMIMLGVAGSSLYGRKEMLQLAPGQAGQVGHYTLQLESVREVRRENYAALEASLTVDDGSGRKQTLYPERRLFDKYDEQINTEVALRSTWREDLHVILGGCEPDGSLATFQVVTNPLVWWIWTGGWVLMGGSLLCLMPRLLGRIRSVAVEEAEKAGPMTAMSVPAVSRRLAGDKRRLAPHPAN